jgi:hypothetical protein
MKIKGIKTMDGSNFVVGSPLEDTGAENGPIVTEILWARKGYGKDVKFDGESYAVKTDADTVLIVPAHNLAVLAAALENKKKKATGPTEADVELPD